MYVVIHSIVDRLSNAGIILTQYGYQDCEPDYGFGPAMRDYYVIHFIKKGKGVYQYKGKEIEVSEGEFFMIPPDETTYYKADKYDPWSYYWIGFVGVEAKYLLKKIGITDNTRKQKYLLENEYSICDMIYSLANKKVENESDKLFETAKLYEIMSWLRRSYERIDDGYKNMNPSNKYLRIAIDFLMRSYMFQTTISDVADYVGIDRTQLYRYFKEELGISPKQYLVNLRMKKAEELLGETQLTIKEIAYSVGYVDAYLFSKMFKKIYGVSPKAFREQCIAK